MIQAENNYLIVTIAKKFTDEVNGIIISTHEHPEQHVTLQGIVHSIPKRIAERMDYEGFTTEDIQIGDTIMFRYAVIYSYAKQASNEAPVYKNMMFVKGKEYWRVDLLHVLARIRDGKLKMVNGKIMVAPFEEQSRIIVPEYMKKVPTRLISSEVTHGKWEGQKVIFDKKKAEQYKVGHYEFVILREDQVLGIEIA